MASRCVVDGRRVAARGWQHKLMHARVGSTGVDLDSSVDELTNPRGVELTAIDPRAGRIAVLWGAEPEASVDVLHEDPVEAIVPVA